MADCLHWDCIGHLSCQRDWIFIQMTDGVFSTDLGMQPLEVHGPSTCAGQFCTIHNASDHHRRHERKKMERMCPHNLGHPDPDDLNPLTEHVCDGCCVAPVVTA